MLWYRVAMFVLHVDTFKARAMFAPRSRAVKNPLEHRKVALKLSISAYS